MAKTSLAMSASDTFPPEQQLIVEVYVRDLSASISFYTAYEFEVLRREEYFAELAWGRNRLYLEQVCGVWCGVSSYSWSSCSR